MHIITKRQVHSANSGTCITNSLFVNKLCEYRGSSRCSVDHSNGCSNSCAKALSTLATIVANSRRFRRQFVAEFGDCRRFWRLSPKWATSRQCGQSFIGTAIPPVAIRDITILQYYNVPYSVVSGHVLYCCTTACAKYTE